MHKLSIMTVLFLPFILALILLHPGMGSLAFQKSNTVGSSSNIAAAIAATEATLKKSPDLTTLPGTTFDVKYTDNTVILDREAALKNLRSISTDRTIFVFNASWDGVRKLLPGKIMLIPRLTVRKVGAISTQGPNYIVGTEDPSITELIKDGTIKWSYPINFRLVRMAFGHPLGLHPP